MLSAFAFIRFVNSRPYAHTNWFGCFPCALNRKKLYFFEARWDNPHGGFQHRIRQIYKAPWKETFGISRVNHKYMELT